MFAGISGNLLISPYWYLGLLFLAFVIVHDELFRLLHRWNDRCNLRGSGGPQPPCSTCCSASLHSSTLKRKWSISFSTQGYSFPPTVFPKKRSTASGACCVRGRGQSWPAKRSPVPHLVCNQAHSTTRWPHSSICPVTQARPASSAWDQTQLDGISGPVLSAWVSHPQNTQG